MPQILTIKTAALPATATGTLVLYAAEDQAPTGAAGDIWAATGLDWQAASSAAAFKGRPGHVLDLLNPQGVSAQRLLVLGSGKPETASLSAWTDRGGSLLAKIAATRAAEAAIVLDGPEAVPAAIVDPGTTAIWEQALDMIEAGQMTLDAFIFRQSTWVAQLVQQYRGATLSIKLPPSPPCPRCGSPMGQRMGKKGAFWSCSSYPECKGTSQVEGSRKMRSIRAKCVSSFTCSSGVGRRDWLASLKSTKVDLAAEYTPFLIR